MKVAFLVPDNRDEFRRYDDPAPVFGPAPSALLEGLSRQLDCEIHVLSCVKRPVSSPERLAENIFYHSLHVPRIGWLRTGYQGCLRALRRTIREIQPDVVHGQGAEKYCALGAAFSGKPNIVTIHGLMRRIAEIRRSPPFSFYWLTARLESLAVARAGGLLCISEYTRRAFQGKARRTWVVPNAVDSSFFNVVRTSSPDSVVLCVGAVCEWKNQIGLIEALDGWVEDQGLSLVFLGKAGEDSYGLRFKQMLSTRTWCIHEGFADDDRLKAHLSKARALVLPSIEDNCPMVVLEAMAVGVPVLGAEIGGVPDLIEDRKTGLLFRPTEPESIRNAFQTLLGAPGLGDQLAAEARRSALLRFHPTEVARRHVEIYREIAGLQAESASPEQTSGRQGIGSRAKM
jgi:glycosyltransferase involved in cell wall biosynthesis